MELHSKLLNKFCGPDPSLVFPEMTFLGEYPRGFFFSFCESPNMFGECVMITLRLPAGWALMLKNAPVTLTWNQWYF